MTRLAPAAISPNIYKQIYIYSIYKDTYVYIFNIYEAKKTNVQLTAVPADENGTRITWNVAGDSLCRVVYGAYD